MMKVRISLVLVSLLLFNCNPSSERKVTITKDFIINPNWDKQNNTFEITKMNLKNTSNQINHLSVSSQQLINSLEINETQKYIANVTYNGNDFSKREIYFKKYNGFFWMRNIYDSESDLEVLESFEKNRWYLFGGLSKINTLYFVFVDANGNFHTIKVPASDWTNI